MSTNRLGGLDGAFLAMESPTAHLHILGVLILDADAEGRRVDLNRVRTMVEDRIHLVPPFRQRLVEVPFGLQHPMLVDDPDFDLDYHIRRASLPKPGGRKELSEYVAEQASLPLDRTRPLWEFHVVEGLERSRTAVVVKIHHGIIDGVSASEILAVFLDPEPHPPAPLLPLFGHPRTRRRDGTADAGHAVPPSDDPREPGWRPTPLPGELEQLRELLGTLPGQVEGVARAFSHSFRAARRFLGSRGGPESSPMPVRLDVPKTSINRAITPHRRVALAELPLAEIDEVREALGGTVNDVVMAVVSGGMRNFFAHRGEMPERSLVALIPVSQRTELEQGTLGNRISALLVDLSDDLPSARERLDHVRAEMALAKEQHRSLDQGILYQFAEAATPAVLARVSRLMTNFKVFDHLQPPCNLVVSNVPGPGIPLYVAGARLLAAYPVGPIMEGTGLNITVFSHEGVLFTGIQGDWDLVPDIEEVATGLRAALAELLVVARRSRRPVPWWHSGVPA